jgi:penicillin amidase
MALTVGGVAWWLVYRPLPQLDGNVVLSGLQDDVRVERDRWGVPHIRANSVEDMAQAQGYVMAQDRLWQMDLLRRIGRGQLSEILGAATLEVDRDFRTLGIARAAERDADLMDPEARRLLEAYARGVNQFVDQHQKDLPLEFSLLQYKPQPWQVSDTLVITGYMYRTLTNTWQRKLERAKVSERVGLDRAKELFSPEAAMDRFVIGDPNIADDGSQRSHVSNDGDDDEDDVATDTVFKASSEQPEPDLKTASVSSDSPDSRFVFGTLLPAFLEALSNEVRSGLGSNNWVVSGAHTATGKPLLANDTHLDLLMPPIWYQVHQSAPGFNVQGFALPGGPPVVIGHNERIAWGFTNNGADVQDLYIETFNPNAPDEYRVHGTWSKAQIINETIRVKGRADEHPQIVVTRHGPVVHREGDKAYALRWSATEPGGLANSYSGLGKAQDWQQFRSILKRVWGPGQNAVYADVDGNIGYIMAARVPVRKKGHGEVPVPGDVDDYEWTGYIPFNHLPQALNPNSGLIVTANGRVAGPKYKPYLTDRWDEPYRTARIYDLLHDKHDLRPTDMLRVQTDTYSYPHAFLAEQLSAAANISPPKNERARKLINRVKDWNGIADADLPEVSFLDATRLAALKLILEPYLGNETRLYTWRSMTFLQRILTERPAKWLPSAFKSYDELLSAAADRAVASLAERSRSERIEDWAWKRFNPLDMFHPLGRQGLLKYFLSITGKPQSGTVYSVRAAARTHGPSERFVANLRDWDDSIFVIPAGESGQPGSGHYADQFSSWYEGKPLIQPFSDAAQVKAIKHTLVLKPRR